MDRAFPRISLKTSPTNKKAEPLILKGSGLEKLEAEEGIEPSNTGFANPRLTTWLLRLRWANL